MANNTTTTTTNEPSLMECFAEQIPLLDFQLDDSPNFYHKLKVWSEKVKKVRMGDQNKCYSKYAKVYYLNLPTTIQGFDIFNGVTEAYRAVCDATSNLHQAWEGMINQLDTSSLFLKKDDSFSPYSGVINTVSLSSQRCYVVVVYL